MYISSCMDTVVLLEALCRGCRAIYEQRPESGGRGRKYWGN